MQNPLMQQKGTSESQRPTSTGTSAQSPTSEVPAFPEAQEDPVAARKRKYGMSVHKYVVLIAIFYNYQIHLCFEQACLINNVSTRDSLETTKFTCMSSKF